MAGKRYPPTDPREWLNRARSNLALAKNQIAGASWKTFALKHSKRPRSRSKRCSSVAALPTRYIHDLDQLLQRLGRNGVKIPKYIWQADELSIYAVETRYPGLSGAVTSRRYRRAVRLAEGVLRWAALQIGKRTS